KQNHDSARYRPRLGPEVRRASAVHSVEGTIVEGCWRIDCDNNCDSRRTDARLAGKNPCDSGAPPSCSVVQTTCGFVRVFQTVARGAVRQSCGGPLRCIARETDSSWQTRSVLSVVLPFVLSQSDPFR